MGSAQLENHVEKMAPRQAPLVDTHSGGTRVSVRKLSSCRTWDSVAGVPSSYSTPPSLSILGMAMAPPGKYGL
eukprot:8207584-Pyramimonas_sp.AAC.1